MYICMHLNSRIYIDFFIIFALCTLSLFSNSTKPPSSLSYIKCAQYENYKHSHTL